MSTFDHSVRIAEGKRKAAETESDKAWQRYSEAGEEAAKADSNASHWRRMERLARKSLAEYEAKQVSP